jgi:hypothetical protein
MITYTYSSLHVMCLTFLPNFKNILIFSTHFNTKIRPVGADLFHADGRTDGQIHVTKLTVIFVTLRTRLKIDHGLTCKLILALALNEIRTKFLLAFDQLNLT